MAQFVNTFIALVALFTSVFAVSPLVVKGADFVNSVDQSRFQIIGVAYQPGGSSAFGNGVDPLSDASVCLRDATLMQRLGVNTIRVYNLDPTLDHQACASIFNAAGIYMILDVNSPLPNQSLDRVSPWNSYNLDYITRVFQVVASFQDFNNTLGFFSGNEVINQQSTVLVPAYIRAVTRDIKDFIAAQSPRSIPVGYSAADVATMLSDTWNYLGCELSNATSSKIDFFGLNSYSWCGNSSFTTSGYDQLVSQFSNTTIPVFFSEYGCNTISPRVFSEVPAIYGPQMTGVMSGGLVYEYSEEPNNYGLVSLNDNNTVSILQDYDNLRTEYDSLNLASLEKSNSTAISLTAPTCEASLIGDDGFDTSFDIPAAPAGVSDLIANGVSGSYPKAFSQVKNTKPSQVVYDVNGEELQGLQLTILAGDQSNLPGNNTSGTSPSTTSSASSPTATKNAALKGGEVKIGALMMAVLTVGFLVKL